MKRRFCEYSRLDPRPIDPQMSLTDLVDNTFLAYNAARLREACQLFARRMLEGETTIGMSLAGALTPAGVGLSAIIPLIQHGFVDWIVSTGANLYYDAQLGLDLPMHIGSPRVNEVEFRREEIVRIYDVLFSPEALDKTNRFFAQVIVGPEFQHSMGTAEFHYRIGSHLHKHERARGLRSSVLSAAYQWGVPIYTSSPGDSPIGMIVAALALSDNRLAFDVSRDVNETTAIVLAAKLSGGKSGVLIVGGGSPKNFVLQTEPQIQEILGPTEKGHEYYLQITDARPDSGGLSGATPSEAVSWGKVDPATLTDTVVCYLDSTVALPILTAYAIAKRGARKPKRLYDRRDEALGLLTSRYRETTFQ